MFNLNNSDFATFESDSSVNGDDYDSQGCIDSYLDIRFKITMEELGFKQAFALSCADIITPMVSESIPIRPVLFLTIN